MAENPANRPPAPANETESARTSRGLAEAANEAEAKQLDEGPEGGRYLSGDVLVDANGKPLADKKKD